MTLQGSSKDNDIEYWIGYETIKQELSWYKRLLWVSSFMIRHPIDYMRFRRR